MFKFLSYFIALPLTIILAIPMGIDIGLLETQITANNQSSPNQTTP